MKRQQLDYITPIEECKIGLIAAVVISVALHVKIIISVILLQALDQQCDKYDNWCK